MSEVGLFSKGEGSDLDKGAAGIAARDAKARAFARKQKIDPTGARLVVVGAEAGGAKTLLVHDDEIQMHKASTSMFSKGTLDVIRLSSVDSVATQGAPLGARTVLIRSLGCDMSITLGASEAEYIKHYIQTLVHDSRATVGPQDSDGASSLQKLKKLLAAGDITEQEYQAARMQVLRGL